MAKKKVDLTKVKPAKAWMACIPRDHDPFIAFGATRCMDREACEHECRFTFAQFGAVPIPVLITPIVRKSRTPTRKAKP
jgi:hypothetical protein